MTPPDTARSPRPGAPPSLDFDHHPLLAIWEVTQACDLACQHCRACATPARDEAELSTAEGLRLLDAIRAMGTPVVVLTGGDPAKRSALPALAPAARARTRFVLVTFDPGTDTPERLRALAAERGMDLSRWSLVRGADGDVRALATVLGVQYSRVGPRDFTHSNVITVVDPQGVVARQVEGLRQPVDAAARAIEALSR